MPKITVEIETKFKDNTILNTWNIICAISTYFDTTCIQDIKVKEIKIKQAADYQTKLKGKK